MPSLKSLTAIRWIGPTPGLSLAFAAAWVAVCYQLLQDWLRGQLPPGLLSALGFACLLLGLVLFALGNVRIGDGLPKAWRQVVVLLQIPAALVVYTSLQDEILLALLVIVATQLAKNFSRLTALLILAVVNLLLIMQLPYLAGQASITTITTFLGFEVFAVLTVGYAYSAQRAHNDLLRIHGELLSTRHLLHESARIEERLRVSRELHDIAGHKLTALKLQLRRIALADLGEASASAKLCAQLADELLVEVRGMVSVLRRNDGIDLYQSLLALVSSVPQPRVQLYLQPDVHITDIEQANTLLRCAQEGLTNALRHSEADLITISLSQENQLITLEVQDNGRCKEAPDKRNGLTGMQERLKALGGALEITSPNHQGLCLRAMVPQEPQRDIA
jgi:signal transduction histidine kinase